jgi:hypothetical protein
MTRSVLVLACVAFVVLLCAGMWWGWRNRAKRQAGLPAPPALPADLGAPELPGVAGVYVGTTFAASWQDRVVHAGLGVRAGAELSWYGGGAVIDRDGAEPVFIPRGDLLTARLAPGLAGTVVGAGGLLVLTWRLGEAVLDTGFRADDKTSYPQWVRTINDAVKAR